MRIKKTSQYIEGGAGLPSYFTTETDTGMKWIDGKTIYRQVISSTTGNANQTKVVATISDLGEIVDLRGYLRTTTQSVPLNFVYNTEQNSCYREGNNIIVRVTANAYINQNCYVVVEYTKN